jgi:hypothetical protein
LARQFPRSRRRAETVSGLTFADPAKIEELVSRTAKPMLLEDRQLLENGLRSGAGAIVIFLTDHQYRKLLL